MSGPVGEVGRGIDQGALEEYKEASSNMRMHAQARYFILPILMAVTGGLATIRFGKDTQAGGATSTALAVLGILIALMLLVVQHRENYYWHHYLGKAQRLEERLGFSLLTFPESRRVFSSTLSTYVAFAAVTVFWLVDLFTRP